MEQLIDIKEAAKLLGLREPTIRKYTMLRILPYRKLGTRVVYRPSELEQWANERRVPTLIEQSPVFKAPPRPRYGKRMTTQLDLFKDRLPARPYCTDRFESGLVIRERMEALKRRFIQPNGPTHLYWLAYDVDRATAEYDWQDLCCPGPNIMAANRVNGHAHLLYGLEVPVRKGPEASFKALRYAAAVEFALCRKLEADEAYGGLICKNPLNPHWRVLTYQEQPYTLGWLADYLNLDHIDYRRRSEPYGLGRNCDLFNATRLWAYRAIRRGYRDFETWRAAVLEHVANLNAFPSPLPARELKSISKSIAKWTWRNMSASGFLAYQSRVGRIGGLASGVARQRLAIERSQALFDFRREHPDASSREIEQRIGIPAGTVRRIRSTTPSPLLLSDMGS